MDETERQRRLEAFADAVLAAAESAEQVVDDEYDEHDHAFLRWYLYVFDRRTDTLPEPLEGITQALTGQPSQNHRMPQDKSWLALRERIHQLEGDLARMTEAASINDRSREQWRQRALHAETVAGKRRLRAAQKSR